MLEAAIDAGAENCETADGVHTVTTSMESFNAVRDTLAQKFGDATEGKIAWLPKVAANVGGEQAEALMDLIDALEDNDDVQDVFTNAEFDAATLQKLSA